MRSYTCTVNMLINKNFLGLDDSYCLIEKFLCSHVGTDRVANIDICSYRNLSKELIAQESPCCSQRETPGLKIASYQYSLLFTVKWLGSFLWKCQLRITAMWIGLGRLRTQNSPVPVLCPVYGPGGVLLFFPWTVAVREKHIELVNAQRCVCVCVCVCIHWHGLPRQHSSNSHYVFCNKQQVLQKKLRIQRVDFWKQAGQILRKMDKIISENSKIPILFLFLDIKQLLVI